MKEEHSESPAAPPRVGFRVRTGGRAARLSGLVILFTLLLNAGCVHTQPAASAVKLAEADETAIRNSLLDLNDAIFNGDDQHALIHFAKPTQRFFREPQILLDERLRTIVESACVDQRLANVWRSTFHCDQPSDALPMRLEFISPAELPAIRSAIMQADCRITGEAATLQFADNVKHPGSGFFSSSKPIKLKRIAGVWKVDFEDQISDAKLGDESDSRLANINNVRFFELMRYAPEHAQNLHVCRVADEISSSKLPALSGADAELRKFDPLPAIQAEDSALRKILPVTNDPDYKPF